MGTQAGPQGPQGPHLDAERWAALQRRERATVEHFARHLAAPCEPCEAFLAGLGEAGAGDAGSAALDALADEALLEAGRTAPHEDALGWARLQRRLGEEGLAAGAARRSRTARVAGVLAVAIAASVVFAVLPARMRTHVDAQEDGMRIKGAASLALELSAREIAERLGLGKSAVTMRLERFRARIKRELLARLLAAEVR